jgi:hypothetical protein
MKASILQQMPCSGHVRRNITRRDALKFIARRSMGSQPARQRIVCLACTELPLAFKEMKTLSVFESEGIIFINSTMAHIDAALEFAQRR